MALRDLSSWFEKQPPRRALWLLLLLGAVLFLPRLGSFGLWDPYEVRIAEAAREMAQTGSLVVPEHSGARPPLLEAAIALGYRVLSPLGLEWSTRLPVALLALLALAACFYAGEALVRRRGALLGTLVLLTAPAFYLGARQLTSFVGPILATTLAVGGLARAAWPRRGGRAPVHLAVGLSGLLLGYLAAGLLLGVAVPLAAVATAALLIGAAPTAGEDVPTKEGTGGTETAADEAGVTPWTRVTGIVLGIGALAAVGVALWAWRQHQPGGAHAGYSALFGGTPREADRHVEATTLLRELGFGLFPWIVLLPLAAARVLPGRSQGGLAGRRGYGRLVLLAWAVCAYFGNTLYSSVAGATAFGAFAALALLIGDYLDEVWDDPTPLRVAGLVAGIGAAAIAQDLFLDPQRWIGAHTLTELKWPEPLRAPPYFGLFLGLAWAMLVGLALATRPASTANAAGSRAWWGRRQGLFIGAALAAFVLTAGAGFWVVPAASRHLSYKTLFTKYKSMVGTGQSPIGKYHVPGKLAEYGNTTELPTLPSVFTFLARPERVFVIAPTDDLAAIDQYAKSRAKPGEKEPTYYVVDDSNAKFLMLSNQLGKERDLNPLRRQVVPVQAGLPHPPQHAVHANFEGKLELVGYDLPDEVDRGQPFKITLYYKVDQALGASYKVFLHFDGPGNRFNGDHVPLDGKFATNYWVPGFYVIDEYTVTPPGNSPTGTYQLYTGFWLGDNRLRVSVGKQDGENRLILGQVRVK